MFPLNYLRIQLQLMSWPSTGPKMFCAGPIFLSQTKNLIASSADPKNFAPAKNLNLLNANHLLSGTKSLNQPYICGMLSVFLMFP